MSELLNQTLYLTLIGSVLPLLLMSFCGFIVSVLQAITQIQEQSISYCVKLVSLIFAIYFLFPYWNNLLQSFFSDSLNLIVLVGRH